MLDQKLAGETPELFPLALILSCIYWKVYMRFQALRLKARKRAMCLSGWKMVQEMNREMLLLY